MMKKMKLDTMNAKASQITGEHPQTVDLLMKLKTNGKTQSNLGVEQQLFRMQNQDVTMHPKRLNKPTKPSTQALENWLCVPCFCLNDPMKQHEATHAHHRNAQP